MSIITNQYQDIPSKERRKEFEEEFYLCAGGNTTSRPGPRIRRFFQSGANWDKNVDKVLALNREILVGGLPNGISEPTRKHIWLNGAKADESGSEDGYDEVNRGVDMDVDEPGGHGEEGSRRQGRSLYY